MVLMVLILDKKKIFSHDFFWGFLVQVCDIKTMNLVTVLFCEDKGSIITVFKYDTFKCKKKNKRLILVDLTTGESWIYCHANGGWSSFVSESLPALVLDNLNAVPASCRVFSFYSGLFWFQSFDNLDSLMRTEVSFRCLRFCVSDSRVKAQIDVRARVCCVRLV